MSKSSLKSQTFSIINCSFQPTTKQFKWLESNRTTTTTSLQLKQRRLRSTATARLRTNWHRKTTKLKKRNSLKLKTQLSTTFKAHVTNIFPTKVLRSARTNRFWVTFIRLATTAQYLKKRLAKIPHRLSAAITTTRSTYYHKNRRVDCGTQSGWTTTSSIRR